MTRAEIEKEFTVRDGRIVSPGKFEGEPVYAPHFWEALLDGFADEDGAVAWFDVTDEDRAEFPELQGIDRVSLETDDNGFVYLGAEESAHR